MQAFVPPAGVIHHRQGREPLLQSETEKRNPAGVAHNLYKVKESPLWGATSQLVRYHGNNEKIFYPPTTVAYGSDGIEGDCPAGTLALFSPWGNVVMYYGGAGRYSGLYILGKAIDGAENIRNLTGTIRVEAVGGTSVIGRMQAEGGGGSEKGYSLNGTVTTDGQRGVIIRSGKKVFVK